MAALRSSEEDVVEIRRTFSEPFEELLVEVSSDPLRAEALATRLTDMRRHAIERHDYYERYCNQYLAIGLAMLPFAFTIGGFVLNFMRTGGVGAVWALPTALGILTFAGTGLAVLILYIRMTSTNYCYRQIEKTRSWYHTHSVLSGTGNADKMSPEQQDADRRDFADNLRIYGEQWLLFMQVPWAPIAEDIERIFTLFVLQSAKRRHVRTLAKVVQWGVTMGTVLLIVGLMYLAAGMGTHVTATAGGRMR
ncbi:MAG: hypothetical protein ABFE07_11830 [Armatimonadia bacterium]